MARMGVGRWTALLGAACVLAAGLGLGGCSNVPKDRYDAALQESADLRQRNASLEGANREKDLQIAQLVAERDQLRNQPPPPAFDTPRSASGRPQQDVARFEVAGHLLFASGQATLNAAAKKELDKYITRIRNQYPNSAIRVEGHTDSAPIRKSSWSSNDELSQARANAVREYMQQKGLRNHIEAVGYGSTKPKSTQAASRRVEIVILGG